MENSKKKTSASEDADFEQLFAAYTVEMKERIQHLVKSYKLAYFGDKPDVNESSIAKILTPAFTSGVKFCYEFTTQYFNVQLKSRYRSKRATETKSSEE